MKIFEDENCTTSLRNLFGWLEQAELAKINTKDPNPTLRMHKWVVVNLRFKVNLKTAGNVIQYDRYVGGIPLHLYPNVLLTISKIKKFYWATQVFLWFFFSISYGNIGYTTAEVPASV